MHFKLSSFLAAAALRATCGSQAGPMAYGICQTGCNKGVVACYAGAGFTFGSISTAGVDVPAAITTCNATLGVCLAACAAVTFFPST
ncbi:uncharacterized protein BXZ73DRAFT_105434 [Epithele typhae]|uniref:uncharacterized protein n=1 Tax=Epithele typhae TaxID=378194 RepID=UPI0020086C82|nr:uncharacterized protein BXZ73DRAFT_105434 [Epithele typhae]KAH9917913.1 hypothetical protein BXZ73DRAFT_105434 [Epithele typhae]